MAATASMFAIVVICMFPAMSFADSTQIAAQISRGKYLVHIAGCTDCHTPGTLRQKPDLTRFLGGSDVGFEIAGLGTFVPPNLTPDKETGLGTWSKQEIITAIQTGVRPDGRILAPIMPWRQYAGMTTADVSAVVDYLQSLPAVHHKVPGPFGLAGPVPVSRMVVLPPDTADQRSR